jgi:hypothetical protein
MQQPKHLNRKLEGSPFNLNFPEASSTPKTTVHYLTEDVFKKKKLNKEDFRAKLIKERSFRLYYKKSALGTASESYCVLVRTKNGIPAQYVLLLDKGSQKKVTHTAEGPRGKIVYACEAFNQFWEHLLSTVEGLPENYETTYDLIDSKWAQFQKGVKAQATTQTQTQQTPSNKPKPATKPAAPVAPKAEPVKAAPATPPAKPATPTQEACSHCNKIPLIPMQYRSKPEQIPNSRDHDD